MQCAHDAHRIAGSGMAGRGAMAKLMQRPGAQQTHKVDKADWCVGSVRAASSHWINGDIRECNMGGHAIKNAGPETTNPAAAGSCLHGN